MHLLPVLHQAELLLIVLSVWSIRHLHLCPIPVQPSLNNRLHSFSFPRASIGSGSIDGLILLFHPQLQHSEIRALLQQYPMSSYSPLIIYGCSRFSNRSHIAGLPFEESVSHFHFFKCLSCRRDTPATRDAWSVGARHTGIPACFCLFFAALFPHLLLCLTGVFTFYRTSFDRFRLALLPSLSICLIY